MDAIYLVTPHGVRQYASTQAAIAAAGWLDRAANARHGGNAGADCYVVSGRPLTYRGMVCGRRLIGRNFGCGADILARVVAHVEVQP